MALAAGHDAARGAPALHGVTAEDVAAVVRQAGQAYGTSSEHLRGAVDD